MAQKDPRINVVMPEDLYRRFSHALIEMGRRNKSEAICEAVEKWLAEKQDG